MSIVALVPTKMIGIKKLCISRGISLEELIKKELKCTDVVVSDFGGVFAYEGQEGRMLDIQELEELADKLITILNK